MNTTRTLRWIAAATVALVGCRTAADDQFSTTEISRGLLTITDMGTDWRETQRDVFDVREPENPALDPTQFCPEAETGLAGIDEVGSQAGADVEFQSKTSNSMVRLQAWSNADVAVYVDTIIAAVRDCDGTQWTDENGVVNKIGSIDGPELGDASVHWSATTTPTATDKGDKLVAVGRTSVVQKGGWLMILQWGGAAPTADDVGVDPVEWAKTVGMAYEMLDGALRR